MTPEKSVIVWAVRQSSWFLPSLGPLTTSGSRGRAAAWAGLSPLSRCQGCRVRTAHPPAWELLFTFRGGYKEVVKAVSLAVVLNLTSSLSPCVCLQGVSSLHSASWAGDATGPVLMLHSSCVPSLGVPRAVRSSIPQQGTAGAFASTVCCLLSPSMIPPCPGGGGDLLGAGIAPGPSTVAAGARPGMPQVPEVFLAASHQALVLVGSVRLHPAQLRGRLL